LGAFGDPGHAFPMIALGRALREHGHEVTLQTWARWRAHVEAEGMAFAAAPEYTVFPSGGPGGEPLDFYEAVVHATRDTLGLVRDLAPEVVVADILTLAPALAAELEGVPRATLIPHVYPVNEPEQPVYSVGARLPRTALGRALWRRAQGLPRRGVERGRVELNATRARLGLPALEHGHGGTSRELALVGTFPQLEYPRAWPAWAHVVGPLMWEPPAAEVELPRTVAHAEASRIGRTRSGRPRPAAPVGPALGQHGAHGLCGRSPEEAPSPEEDPLVLVAPSTAQDPDHRLLQAALEGLADMRVRVLATWNRRLPSRGLRVPANAKVVEWISYARTMMQCDVVVCHAGHGTMVRALASGCAVVACPHVGDMNENAARLDWAGAGVRVPWRLVGPRTVRLAVERALETSAIRARAGELARWAETHDPGADAAVLVEELACGEASVAGLASTPATAP
jgi:UDP:flavonoid glycosyltransferase YjiC (YdhE family)